MSSAVLEVAFDTAGSVRAGIGHVVRTFALADQVRRLGARPTLLRPPTVSLIGSTRLGPARRPDVVAVDRPDVSAELLRRHRARWPTARLVALDYYGAAVDGVDAVINLNAARERRPAPRRPGYYRGLRFATLRPSFREHRRSRRAVRRSVRRIIVGFGGTDPDGWTVSAVAALRPIAPWAAIDVLSGRAIDMSGPQDARVRVHVAVKDPAPLLLASDLAVIGGGTMMMEAACLGVPAIVLPRTTEERGFAREFVGVGAVRVVLPPRGFPAAGLRRAAAALLDDRRLRTRMRRAGRALVDGRGAERVARLLIDAAGRPRR